MAKVLEVADPRVIDEQGVVLNDYVGPLNWEHYKIPASGLSNTQITFANFVTLGTNRLYESNFQIEYTVELHMPAGVGLNDFDFDHAFKFNPFPLHWVTDQLRCNINGSACMSRPQESLLQRMMYWDQKVLDENYSYCPHDKPTLIAEPRSKYLSYMVKPTFTEGVVTGLNEYEMRDWDDFRIFNQTYNKGAGRSYGKVIPCVSHSFNADTGVFSVTFREPILCPPFNQRLDRIYTRPLFNITSIDIVYQLNDIRKMILPMFDILYRPALPTDTDPNADYCPVFTDKGIKPSTITANITSAQICFNVASLRPTYTVPPMMTLPYYDNVSYVTQGPAIGATQEVAEFTSGVYTLAQVPQAIYVFVSENQLYRSSAGQDLNPSLCPIRNINVTLGNNTQILTTTDELERYRMQLANGLTGCAWDEFNRQMILPPLNPGGNLGSSTRDWYKKGGHCSRCIYKFRPGYDLLIPDQHLTAGTDAGQLVFQVRLTADVSAVPTAALPYLSLWVMFEYCGVLTIEPVHANIDMVPIKVPPSVNATPMVVEMPTVAPENPLASVQQVSSVNENEGNPVGTGFFGNIMSKVLGFVNKLHPLSGVIPNIARSILGLTPLETGNPSTDQALQGISSFSNGIQGLTGRRWDNGSMLDYFFPPQPGRKQITIPVPGDTGIRREGDETTGSGLRCRKKRKGGTIIGDGELGNFYN